MGHGGVVDATVCVCGKERCRCHDVIDPGRSFMTDAGDVWLVRMDCRYDGV